MKLKTVILFILVPVLLLSISACNSNNLWDNKPGSNDDPTVLDDVTMTSIKAGAGQIDLAWIDPAATEFNAIDITCTVTSTSTELSTAEALPGDQAYSITGVTDGIEYTVTVTVTDSKGNSSAGISMDITPQAVTVEGHFIYTADDMNAVRSGVTGYDNWTLDDIYYLMADIDLSGYSSWTPIGETSPGFEGNFYGNNHTVNNLTINNSVLTYIGLFGYITGDIKDLDLVNVNIQANNQSGALAGYSYGNNIENCTMTGSVQGDVSVGGLFGRIESATIVNSHSDGYVSTASDSAGGLIGESIGGTIDNCYATGDVDGAASLIGGLVGYNNAGTITNGSYASGNVSGGNQTGGLVGQNDVGTITDSYYSTGTVKGLGQNIGGLVGKSSGALTGCYVSGNVSVITMQSDFIGGLVGQSSGTITDSYTTSTCNITVTLSNVSAASSKVNIGGLVGVTSTNITNCYVEGDVDVDIIIAATGTETIEIHIGGLIGLANPSTIDGSRMIGTTLDVDLTGSGTTNNDYLYTGGLIGDNSATIQNNCYATCSVTQTTDSNVNNEATGGLIGMNSGDISDSYSEGSVTSTENNVGGLVGESSGSITGCYYTNTTGSVSGTGSFVGGLVGNNSSTVINCSVTSTINGNGYYVGGLIGYNNSSSITNSHFTGRVDNIVSSTGGLIGYNVGGGNINGCSSFADVSGGNSTGGLIGENNSPVSESWAEGSTTGYQDVGGLIGLNTGTVDRCYANGDVTGDHYVGGLVGQNNNNALYVTTSYATGDVYPTQGSGGGFVGYNYTGNIQYCYAHGDVIGTVVSVNGLGGFGGNIIAGTIDECYCIGVVTDSASSSLWGGLFGVCSITPTNCYYNLAGNLSGLTTWGDGISPFSNMKLTVYTNFTFSTIWGQDNTTPINSGYPYLLNNYITP